MNIYGALTAVAQRLLGTGKPLSKEQQRLLASELRGRLDKGNFLKVSLETGLPLLSDMTATKGEAKPALTEPLVGSGSPLSVEDASVISYQVRQGFKDGNYQVVPGIFDDYAKQGG